MPNIDIIMSCARAVSAVSDSMRVIEVHVHCCPPLIYVTLCRIKYYYYSKAKHMIKNNNYTKYKENYVPIDIYKT
jgi:hypothetical protein